MRYLRCSAIHRHRTREQPLEDLVPSEN
jgi:hypothetical protein